MPTLLADTEALKLAGTGTCNKMRLYTGQLMRSASVATRHRFTRIFVVSAVFCALAAFAVSQSASATEAEFSELAIHVEAVRMRLERGERDVAKEWLTRLAQRHPPKSCALADAVALAALLARVGEDTMASGYFRAAAERAPDEASLDALERSHLAAAIYAIGRPEGAMEVLQRCRQRWPDRPLRCRPWAMAEVAAAKDDWKEAAKLLDAELMPSGKPNDVAGLTAPVRVLKLRLRVAWHAGDKLEIGRWRSILIRRGVPPDTPATRQKPAKASPEPPVARSGLVWIVMSLTLILVTALLLARRGA